MRTWTCHEGLDGMEGNGMAWKEEGAVAVRASARSERRCGAVISRIYAGLCGPTLWTWGGLVGAWTKLSRC